MEQHGEAFATGELNETKRPPRQRQSSRRFCQVGLCWDVMILGSVWKCQPTNFKHIIIIILVAFFSLNCSRDLNIQLYFQDVRIPFKFNVSRQRVRTNFAYLCIL